MTRAAAVLLLLAALTLPSAAQETPTTPAPTTPPQDDVRKPVKPDYSKPTLIRLFAEEEKKKQLIEWDDHSLKFNALGMRWRISPMMMPLSGSFPTTRGLEMPNPFELSHTEIPQTPRTWREGREISAEMKRIEQTERKREKERAKVAAQPQ